MKEPDDKAMLNVFGAWTGQEELDEISPSVHSSWLGLGPKVAQFEAAFSARLDLPGLCLLDSGSNALFLAIKLLDLPPHSEVIVPSLTWVACAHAVLLAGHRPVFADVDLATQNITAEIAARAFNRNTKAIMVVHYAGKPVDMKSFPDFHVPLIEDAAHAVDSKIDGSFCGSFGDVAIYSFDAIKNIAMPEGGGLTAKDPALIERARSLRYCGISKSGHRADAGQRWWEHSIQAVMPKMLPNDINAGIGLAQLRKLDAHQTRRRVIWRIYQEEFSRLAWLTTPQEAGPNEQHSYFTYLIRLERRDALAGFLRDKGIYTTFRYYPLHMNPIYQSQHLTLPNCEQLNREGLNLPLHPRLSDSDIDRVIQGIRDFQ